MNKQRLPKPFDVEQMNRYREIWHGSAKLTTSPEQESNDYAIGEFPVSAVLDCIFANSPYLSRIAIHYPEYVERLVALGPDESWNKFLQEMQDSTFNCKITTHQLTRSLRQYKKIAALHIALCDLTMLWDLDNVVEQLSKFADKCVQAALHCLILSESENGNIEIGAKSDPCSNIGIFVLGLGKLGAAELNYSSDIDLIFLFDKAKVPYTGKKSAQEFSVKLAKGLIKLLDERTSDGYVFRTDMRLRPDPASTSVAISTEAAELYYESWGQNWERAALIKARYIAGDMNSANDFLSSLSPFVWRKSLDFYAIQDIHSIKRQIDTSKSGSKINALGHNIKTGRGGIREIELFVQIQQLIWGGRRPSLRSEKTLDALRQLHKEEYITIEAHNDLISSYRYLRTLEHRIQMINDEQSQTIPEDTIKAEALAYFFGYDSLEIFKKEVSNHLQVVEGHYSDLFEDTPALTVDGNLVFTGADHDPDTLETLEKMGYENPTAISQIIRSWHHGKTRATRSTRSRQILTELVPRILVTFSKTSQADRAFLNFDQSLTRIKSGVQLFSVFHSNPEILDLIAEIMGDAPRLANYLTASTHRLDYVLEPSFYNKFPSKSVLYEQLTEYLCELGSTEEKLEGCVRWTNDLRFRAGVLVLRGIIPPSTGSEILTSIADVVIQIITTIISTEFREKFGVINNSSLYILAYGKLGSGELMPTSDLDIVIIYDSEANIDSVGTERSLPVTAYFIRLAQRIISALTIRTAEGRLYEVDLRLRPSGHQGPVACSLSSFQKYQLSEAWIWEHLALTKARIVFASEGITKKLHSVIRSVLDKSRTKQEIAYAIAEMRMRLGNDKANHKQQDIKRVEGGLTDTEFLVQFYSLSSGLAGREGWHSNTIESIKYLVDSGEISRNDGSALRSAFSLWLNILWLIRLSLDKCASMEDIPMGLRERLLGILNVEDSISLDKAILDTRHKISKLIDRDINFR